MSNLLLITRYLFSSTRSWIPLNTWKINLISYDKLIDKNKKVGARFISQIESLTGMTSISVNTAIAVIAVSVISRFRNSKHLLFDIFLLLFHF